MMRTNRHIPSRSSAPVCPEYEMKYLRKQDEGRKRKVNYDGKLSYLKRPIQKKGSEEFMTSKESIGYKIIERNGDAVSAYPHCDTGKGGGRKEQWETLRLRHGLGY
ncbi:hypothetical protein L6452_30557 [Arctium lappa]|uniref:Uncharacterized protein n=1 Tax=Arctium lappa TaxID=4217 RepID=A0ACB8ZHM1_ARCLA|nr:hypothetical protein L6452_30557 [Arctium lappa]